ncbi:MAG: hypothetical protein WC280_01815 [Patescibacteria group bacterium]
MEIVFEVIRIEDENILLKSADGQEVFWPISKSPKDLKIGAHLNFLISDNDLSLAQRNQKAKDILNEILNV